MMEAFIETRVHDWSNQPVPCVFEPAGVPLPTLDDCWQGLERAQAVGELQIFRDGMAQETGHTTDSVGSLRAMLADPLNCLHEAIRFLSPAHGLPEQWCGFTRQLRARLLQPGQPDERWSVTTRDEVTHLAEPRHVQLIFLLHGEMTLHCTPTGGTDADRVSLRAGAGQCIQIPPGWGCQSLSRMVVGLSLRLPIRISLADLVAQSLEPTLAQLRETGPVCNLPTIDVLPEAPLRDIPLPEPLAEFIARIRTAAIR